MFEMMMVGADEGSPVCRLKEEDLLANDVVLDLDELWGFAAGAHDPPQDSRLDDLHFIDAITAMRTSEEVTWTEEIPGFSAASPQHNFEASEYRRACSDGIVDSAWNPSISNREMLEPSSRFSQADDLLYTPEVCWAEDEIPGVGLASSKDNLEATESRRSLSDGFGEPSLDSGFTYGEMLEPSSQISQGNGLFYMHVNDGLQNAISPCQSNSKKAPIETFNHSEGFNCYGANHIMNKQQSSNKNASTKAPVMTPNYGEVSSFHRFNHVIHKRDSSNFSHLNHDDYLFGINEYSAMPSTGNESKKHSNTLPNEFSKTDGHIKVKKNINFVSSRDIVSRASDEVDNAIYGGPCVSSTNEGIKLSSSKCLPLVSCENYALHLKDETKDKIFESRSALPSLGMVGETPVKNSDVVAHYRHSVVQVSEHSGVLPPIKTETVKMENEVSKFDDNCLSKITYQGVQNHTFKQNNVNDDSDLCILENMSTPACSNRIAMSEKLVGAKQILTARDPGNQIITAQPKRKPNNERAIYRVALQDLSQPKSEATPPSGLLSVPLLKHQRIALSWMVNKETKSACCSGGILADDQGLGKTISTIALILKERSPSSKALKTIEKESATETLNLDDDVDDGVSESYCVTEGAKPLRVNGYSIPMQAKGRPSGGTLVVCPTSVLRQWSEELHSKVTSEADLSVLVYYGSNRTKDPLELAKYDVVVTTYAIVSMEVPKQPIVNENEDQRGSPYKDSSSCGKRKTIETFSDRKSCMNKKSKKGIDNEVQENVSGPLAQVGWFRVVLDEAQSIKNHRTQVARACWGLRAKRRWCLSGTPIQNSIDDLYSYFRFLRHEPYAVFRTFCEQLKVPIHKNPRNGYKKLQAVLKTIMLRRTKGTFIDGEPIINLPPKTIELRKIDFSTEERDFYSRLEADSRAQFAEYAAAGTVKQNYVNILLMLLRLRQACDHPLLVKGLNSNVNMASSIEMAKKLPREKQSSLLSCLEASLAICGICNDPPEDAVVTVCGHVFCNQCICELITGDDTQCPTKKCKTHLTKSCVFSITTLRSALSDQLSVGNAVNCPDSQVAEVSEPRKLSCPKGSSKIRAALDLLLSLCKPHCAIRTNSSDHAISKEDNRTSEEDMGRGSVKGVGGKAIVFSQWTGMLDLLEACLKSSSIQYRRLDGTMAVAARDRAVKDFNSLPEVSVIIMSLKAASLGLNMVAACNVLLLDLWWNPTTEDQAIDRAHRIGQRRPVSVFRLTVKDTVEDRILALQQKKRKMVAYAFGEDETGTRQSRLTVDDLKYLFRVG